MKKLLSMLDVRRHNIPVYQNRYYWFIAPLVVLLIALICGTVYSTEGNQYDGFAFNMVKTDNGASYTALLA